MSSKFPDRYVGLFSQSNLYGGRGQDASDKQPNEAIKSIENKIVNSPSEGVVARDYPRRPAYGSAGGKVVVWANYFEMEVPKDMALHRFTIGEIEPKVSSKKKELIIRQLMVQAAILLEKKVPVVVSDFKSYILSMPNELPGGDEMNREVVYPPDKDGVKPRSQKTYTVPIKKDKTFQLSELAEYLASTDPSAVYHAKDEVVQTLNILRNYHPRMAGGNIITIGAHKVFIPSANNQEMDLSGGLIGLKGSYASIRLATSRVLVNVNVSHAAFYRHGPLLGLVRDYRDANRAQGISYNDYKLAAFLKRLKVQPNLKVPGEGGQSKPVHGVRTIWGLATKQDGLRLNRPPRVPRYGANAQEVSFWYEKDGKSSYITVYDFFKESKIDFRPYTIYT